MKKAKMHLENQGGSPPRNMPNKAVIRVTAIAPRRCIAGRAHEARPLAAAHAVKSVDGVAAHATWLHSTMHDCAFEDDAAAVVLRVCAPRDA